MRPSRAITEGAIGLLIAAGFVGLITLIALFMFGGIEDPQFFDKTTFYFGLFGVSAAAIIALTLLEAQGKTWANVLFHDPDKALLSGTFVGKALNRPWTMFNFFLVFFLIIGIFSVTTNTFFTGIIGIEQQVTETGDLLLNTEPAATSETLMQVAILSVMAGLVSYYARRQKWDAGTKVLVLCFVVPILFGLLWVGYHGARYAGQEHNLVATFIFGAGSSLITILTGSILGAWVWHFTSNMFARANQLFGDDRIVLAVIVFAILYVTVLLIKRFALPTRKRTGVGA